MNRELLAPEACLKFASNYIGLQEIAGGDDNPLIVNMFAKIGHSWVKDDETAWCSCFVNFVAMELALSKSGKLDARSWLNVGEEVKNPQPGDVVVFWRESKSSWKGHVGFFNGYDKNGNIFVLGGNQGNEVCTKVYSKNRVLGFRRLLNAS